MYGVVGCDVMFKLLSIVRRNDSFTILIFFKQSRLITAPKQTPFKMSDSGWNTIDSDAVCLILQ